MSAGFPTTQWSIVLAAQEGASTQARAALEALCEAYWYPLYAYVRRSGHGPEEARDLTQSFFTDLLERKALLAVDRAKGRFRSFLRASLENFLSHERERAGARKRGGGATTFSLDAADAEGRFAHEPVEQLTPEQVFERRWGLTVMARAMARLETESGEGSRREQFLRLRPYLTGSEPQTPHREVAASLGLSEGAVRTAIHRMRQSYGRLLREEIATTLADPADLDDELRHLLAVIRPWREPSS